MFMDGSRKKAAAVDGVLKTQSVSAHFYAGKIWSSLVRNEFRTFI